jgi:activator of 2-hydroxyglutaryl-CoA dehydratase
MARVVAGAHQAAARRIAQLIAQCGGAAQNPLLRAAVAREIEHPLAAVRSPQFVGAYGAALSA